MEPSTHASTRTPSSGNILHPSSGGNSSTGGSQVDAATGSSGDQTLVARRSTSSTMSNLPSLSSITESFMSSGSADGSVNSTSGVNSVDQGNLGSEDASSTVGGATGDVTGSTELSSGSCDSQLLVSKRPSLSQEQEQGQQHMKKKIAREYTDSVLNMDVEKDGYVTPTTPNDDNSTKENILSPFSAAERGQHHAAGSTTDSFKPTFFKPFDPKTGQFVNDDNDLESTESDVEMANRETDNREINNNIEMEIKSAGNIPSQDENLSSNSIIESTRNNDPQNLAEVNTESENINSDQNQKLLSDIKKITYNSSKFRSQSVPTILHSSLRRLTALQQNQVRHNQILMNSNNYNNHNLAGISGNSNTSHQHQIPAQSAGIKKRKYVRSHRSILRATNQSMQGSHPSVMFGKSAFSDDLDTSSSSSASSNSSLPTSIARINIHNSTLDTQIDNLSSSKRSLLLNNGKYKQQNSKFFSFCDLNSLSLEERISYIRNTPRPLPLPPINLQCLKEIDLQEIVKNPQLRHDIVFDPLLQFRPNLDGERGIKKTQLADKYWNDVENEIYVYMRKPEVFDYHNTRLVPLFDTLRDVLLTTVPQKESEMINGVLDTELTVQELVKGSLHLSNFSDWLAELFKHHCAPMRDMWVDKMNTKFKESESESSLPKLIEALKLVFQILEAMKLDIANHQIRILRPALISNAVEFEKQYFHPLIYSNKIDLKSSLDWFNNKFEESESLGLIKKGEASAQDAYRLCTRSIISLLSCRKMVRSYPTALIFDHTRLILLRADLRQIVCLMVCRLLFQQLVASDTTIPHQCKAFINKSYPINTLKRDIISITTDEHGNCRWTKNIMSIAVHLCKVINDLKMEFTSTKDSSSNMDDKPSSVLPILDQAKINFAKSWLSKQTQPLSEVYAVLEKRVFKSLEDTIYENSGCTLEGRVKQDFIHFYNSTPANNDDKVSSSHAQTSTMTNLSNSHNKQALYSVTEMEEFETSYYHLYSIVNFHWSVFGTYYMESLGTSMKVDLLKK